MFCSQGSIPPLQPPYRASIPLWLALLLKRQRRANIVPPPWLSSPSLESILKLETTLTPFSPPPSQPASLSNSTLSPPFLPSGTADAPPDALPYHWLEMGEMLLDVAADDIPDPDGARRLMRDLREVRMAKLRAGVGVLEGGREVNMNGVGAMEISEGRAFIAGAVDGLRWVPNAFFPASFISFYRKRGLSQPGKSGLRRSFQEKRERPRSARTISEAPVMTMTMRWICRENKRGASEPAWCRSDVFHSL